MLRIRPGPRADLPHGAGRRTLARTTARAEDSVADAAHARTRRRPVARAFHQRAAPDRIERAVTALQELGAVVEIEHDARQRGKVRLRGYSCPLASATATHPKACKVIEAFPTKV